MEQIVCPLQQILSITKVSLVVTSKQLWVHREMNKQEVQVMLLQFILDL